jgi:asparagine synthase (glutamine-hydrolysing)
LTHANAGADRSRDRSCSILAIGGVTAFGRAVMFWEEPGAVVVLVGRPRWRGDGQVEPGELPRRVLETYRKIGTRVLASLSGSFTLVLLDDRARCALLAIDRMGVSSLFYKRVDPGVVFGLSLQDLVECLETRPSVNLQGVFNYVFLHCVPGPATVLAGAARLLPGEYVEVRDGRVVVDSYWKPRYDEATQYDEQALQGDFRHLLKQAVERALQRGNAGAFLSGGTDSSTVAGLLTQALGAPARTYSIGFEAAGYDEMSYARIAAQHFGTDHHEYYVTPEDVLAMASSVASFCDQPFGNASAVPAYYCAMLAAVEGVEVMFGGDGGDELFGGNERYAMQAIYGTYDGLPAALRKGLIEPAVAAMPWGSRMTLVRKARGFLSHIAMPVPMRVYAHNMVLRSGTEAVFDREFLQRVDPEAPAKIFCGIYDDAEASSVLNRMLAVDLRFTLADNDLYKVSRMCELAGVESAFPMLDDDLVDFSLRLPTHFKLKGRRLRYFFKQALRDFLPPDIIAKRKHGFGLPVGLWMQSHPPLRDVGYDAARALAARGIFRPEFLDAMMKRHQSDDAAYWGNELWVMLQLELWLQQHGWPAGAPLV